MHRSSEDHPLITSIHLVKSRVEAEYCVFKPNLLLLSTFCVDLVGTDAACPCPLGSGLSLPGEWTNPSDHDTTPRRDL